MADLRPLRRSQRLRGEGPEVGLGESLHNLTPLRRLRQFTFTIDPESRGVESPRKHRRMEPFSAAENSDSFDPLYQSFPFLDPNNPTFEITAPLSSMEGLNSTAASSTSFSA